MVNADKSLRREISKPQDIRDLFVSRFKHMGTPKVVNDTKVPTKSPGKHDEPMNDRESITRVGIDNTPVMGFTSKESSLQDEHTDKPTDENTDEHTDEHTDKPTDENTDKPTDEPTDEHISEYSSYDT